MHLATPTNGEYTSIDASSLSTSAFPLIYVLSRVVANSGNECAFFFRPFLLEKKTKQKNQEISECFLLCSTEHKAIYC
jgi:hypothetical protein